MDEKLIDLDTILTNINLDFVGLLFLLVVIILFSIFAFLVERQVKILNKTIQTPMRGLLNLLASLQLAAALLLLIVVIFLILL